MLSVTALNYQKVLTTPRYFRTVRKIAPITLYLNKFNPILNREIASPWHGKAQTAEIKDVVKANRQSWYPHERTDFLTLLNTEQIQRYINKNTARTLHLWHYFMQNLKAPQAKKNSTYFIFYSSLLSIFLRICEYESGFAVENPQNSVWLDWLSAQPKKLSTPLWRVCQPWIHESECFSNTPFARNTVVEWPRSAVKRLWH